MAMDVSSALKVLNGMLIKVKGPWAWGGVTYVWVRSLRLEV